MEWNISVIFQLVIKTAKSKSHIQSHTLTLPSGRPLEPGQFASLVGRIIASPHAASSPGALRRPLGGFTYWGYAAVGQVQHADAPERAVKGMPRHRRWHGSAVQRASVARLPKVHLIVKNRLTQYMGPASAYATVLAQIDTVLGD